MNTESSSDGSICEDYEIKRKKKLHQSRQYKINKKKCFEQFINEVVTENDLLPNTANEPCSTKNMQDSCDPNLTNASNLNNYDSPSNSFKI